VEGWRQRITEFHSTYYIYFQRI